MCQECKEPLLDRTPQQERWRNQHFYHDTFPFSELFGGILLTILRLLISGILLHYRLFGQHTTRTGQHPTYPFTYDQLDAEFDQDGSGVFALPATGQNAKNMALRKFDGIGATFVQLISANLALTLVDWAPYWTWRFRIPAPTFGTTVSGLSFAY